MFPITIHTPVILCAAVAIVMFMTIVIVRRKLPIPRSTKILLIIGATLLAIAAGQPLWNRHNPQTVNVMVDLSPSTRGADFRDRGKLAARIHQLLGDNPYQLTLFADTNHPADSSTPLQEIPVNSTIFSPPPSSPILLFSDARFDLPSDAPPTYIVADPGLEDVNDAAINRLDLRNQTIAATVTSPGNRILNMQGASGPTTAPAPSGTTVISRPLKPGDANISFALSPGDRWPENDTMNLRVTPPPASQKWWVGSNPPSPAWRTFSPANLPADAATYLAPSIIVLNNIAADELSPAITDRLAQYARDLGGSVLILGGDHDFAAGGYPGSPLETLSPLASSPPQPTILWMLLADASGSMADDAGGSSRWNLASSAIIKLLTKLPPDDPVQVGQFSDVLRWWPVGKNARETATMRLPPADAQPHGPTNLEAALNRLGEDADTTTPKQLLILSDCDVRIDHPDQLIDLFKQKKIQLHVLAIAQGEGLPTIRKIAQATGGGVLEQFDPKQWIDSVSKLMQSALPNHLMETTARVTFTDRAAQQNPIDVAKWNRVWIKPSATSLAHSRFDNETIPMAATWTIGRGQITAIAFSPSAQLTETLTALLATSPRDPRFTITWNVGPTLKISIDAIESQTYLNDLNLSLETQGADTPGATESHPIPQTAPGRYELKIPAPRHPTIATIRHDNTTIDRKAIPGRYAPEFDALGNDHAAMRELAESTGGKVIFPTDQTKINFNWPTAQTPLATWLTTAGAILIAIAVVRWRIN